MFTHYLVVDQDDDKVLAWFPLSEDGPEAAQNRAHQMAFDTGHRVERGLWLGQWVFVEEGK